MRAKCKCATLQNKNKKSVALFPFKEAIAKQPILNCLK